jgi:DNA topoisomerase IB
VAHYLGNTPAVCRASYIDPRIFDRFDSGLTISGVLPQLGDEPDLASIHGAPEEAVLDLIAEDEGSGHVEPVGELEKLAA